MITKDKPVPKPMFYILCCIGVLISALAPMRSSAGRLVTFDDAQRHGLERVWFAQVSVDLTQSRVSHWRLHEDQLFALSTSGTLQSLNAETGETRWTVRVGTPNGAITSPSVNDRFVAIVGGTRLYVIDSADGHVLWSRQLGSVVTCAPALSDTHVFVGLMNGQVEAYSLEDPAAPVWRHQSVGRIFHSPVVGGGIVSWATNRGFLYVAENERPRVMYRVEINDEIVAPPAELSPNIYVSTGNGYLYCLDELSGAEHWRISTGFPILRKPAIVGETVYVASDQPALHAVSSPTGQELWFVDGAAQFVSEAAQHIYAMESLGTLLILDKQSGGVVGRLKAGEGTTALENDQSDRIFLVDDRGLVQCLRERDALEPTYYRRQVDENQEAVEEEASKSPFTEDPSDESVPPPVAEEEPADDFGDQFQPAEQDSEDDKTEEDGGFFF